jgi:hypothetical protein
MRFAQEISVFNPFAIEKKIIGLNTSITQTSQRISLQAEQIAVIDGKVETATAELSVMAEEIESKVENSTFTSSINQLSNQISSEVTARQNGDSSLSSRITQNANAITSKVSRGDVVSVINQSADQITISSNRIKIDSTYFHLSNDGQITATRGIIGDSDASSANKWTIGGGHTGNNNRAWIYSGSKSYFNSRNIAGTYIGTDGISMRGTESGINNFLELKDGIIKTTCVRIYDGTGANEKNILLDNQHRISFPYGIQVGNGDTRTSSLFSFDTYFDAVLGITGGTVWLGQHKTTNVGAEDGDSYTGTTLRFRSESNGGLEYVKFDCPVANSSGDAVFVSDRRLKDEIEDLDKEEARDFIMKLKPSSFVFKQDDGKRVHHGVIAQDLLDVVGERDAYVRTFNDEDHDFPVYTVAYTEFLADLIATVQLQQYEIDRLMGAE